jgi:hypothetical protein
MCVTFELIETIFPCTNPTIKSNYYLYRRNNVHGTVQFTEMFNSLQIAPAKSSDLTSIKHARLCDTYIIYLSNKVKKLFTGSICFLPV